MEILMELSRILITELGEQQVIVLREKGGKRSFPIMIGIGEALAIDRRLKNKTTPRPMTHDLLASVIQSLGGTLEKIVINDLRMLTPKDMIQTFIATLHIRQNGQVVEVDSRPSDAIALGVAFNTPIYVEDHVLEEVVKEGTTQESRLELLKRRLHDLSEKMAEIGEMLANEDFLRETPPEIIDEQRRQLDDMQAEYDAINRVLKKLG
jgi:uncharacterized protein